MTPAALRLRKVILDPAGQRHAERRAAEPACPSRRDRVHHRAPSPTLPCPVAQPPDGRVSGGWPTSRFLPPSGKTHQVLFQARRGSLGSRVGNPWGRPRMASSTTLGRLLVLGGWPAFRVPGTVRNNCQAAVSGRPWIPRKPRCGIPQRSPTLADGRRGLTGQPERPRVPPTSRVPRTLGGRPTRLPLCARSWITRRRRRNRRGANPRPRPARVGLLNGHAYRRPRAVPRTLGEDPPGCRLRSVVDHAAGWPESLNVGQPSPLRPARVRATERPRAPLDLAVPRISRGRPTRLPLCARSWITRRAAGIREAGQLGP